MTRLETLTPDQWAEVRRMRADWLGDGMSTAPADRPRAEAAITEMYRLIGKPPPQFVWVTRRIRAGIQAEGGQWAGGG